MGVICEGLAPHPSGVGDPSRFMLPANRDKLLQYGLVWPECKLYILPSHANSTEKLFLGE